MSKPCSRRLEASDNEAADTTTAVPSTSSMEAASGGGQASRSESHPVSPSAADPGHVDSTLPPRSPSFHGHDVGSAPSSRQSSLNSRLALFAASGIQLVSLGRTPPSRTVGGAAAAAAAAAAATPAVQPALETNEDDDAAADAFVAALEALGSAASVHPSAAPASPRLEHQQTAAAGSKRNWAEFLGSLPMSTLCAAAAAADAHAKRLRCGLTADDGLGRHSSDRALLPLPAASTAPLPASANEMPQRGVQRGAEAGRRSHEVAEAEAFEREEAARLLLAFRSSAPWAGAGLVEQQPSPPQLRQQQQQQQQQEDYPGQQQQRQWLEREQRQEEEEHSQRRHTEQAQIPAAGGMGAPRRCSSPAAPAPQDPSATHDMGPTAAHDMPRQLLRTQLPPPHHHRPRHPPSPSLPAELWSSAVPGPRPGPGPECSVPRPRWQLPPDSRLLQGPTSPLLPRPHWQLPPGSRLLLGPPPPPPPPQPHSGPLDAKRRPFQHSTGLPSPAAPTQQHAAPHRTQAAAAAPQYLRSALPGALAPPAQPPAHAAPMTASAPMTAWAPMAASARQSGGGGGSGGGQEEFQGHRNLPGRPAGREALHRVLILLTTQHYMDHGLPLAREERGPG